MKLLIVSLGVLCAAGCAIAQNTNDPFADIQAYNRADYDRTLTKCDQLGAHPNDPERVGEGTERAEMDLPAVIEACEAAVAANTENPRLNYQLARAYGYSGRHSEGNTPRLRALNAGYPQSLFVVGYIRITGWDGAEADLCYGGELVRRSAVAGRMAGLVGFPHYALTGVFDKCLDYPSVDVQEMRDFLEAASEKEPDFYQRLLIEQLQASLGNY